MAQSRTYRCRAIVLDKTKLGESDLILTLLADDGRQIRAVAKGARRPGSRLAARCELCCEVDALLSRGRNLDIVSQAELIAAPLGASPGYDLLAAASAVVEVARFCSFEDAEDAYVFAITERALAVLGGSEGPLEGPHLDLVTAAHTFKLTAHMGYRPDFFSCVSCGDTLVSYFSAQAGGVLCASCATSVAGAEEVDAATVRWLRALMALRFDELTACAIEPAQATLLLAMAHTWAAVHLDARLRAYEFLLGC